MPTTRCAAATGGLVLIFFGISVAAASPETPQPVSPGAAQERSRVANECPGFSWAAAPGEGPLELVVYRFGADDEPVAVVQKTLPGTAQSWTPSLSECLEAGRPYAWSLRRGGDEPGPWSETYLFEVAEAPTEAEVAGAVGVIQRYFTEQGDTEAAEALAPLAGENGLDPETAESVRRALAERAGRADADARRAKAKQPAPGASPDSVASAGTKSIGNPAIIRAANQETSGVNYGLAGEASSPDGAAVAASNLGGGPDVALLDPNNAPAFLSESGLLFDDSGDVVFDFQNVGGGAVQLRQDGTELVTAASDQDTLAELSCSSNEVAKWDGSGWACAVDENTDTTYDADAGLDLTGTTFSLDTAFTDDRYDDRYWKQGGNTGIDPGTEFLGTTDNTALVMRVDNKAALRVVPSDDNDFSPNVIAGHPDNLVNDSTDNDPPVVGAVAAGGGTSTSPNEVGEDFATVGGGSDNTASGREATVGGGGLNEASNLNAVVGGGRGNVASGEQATVGGGSFNTAGGEEATVGGGGANDATGEQATVGGGGGNVASGNDATVGGGGLNTASAYQSTVGGGRFNSASGLQATVPGGMNNNASGDRSLAAGAGATANHGGAFVWSDSTDTSDDSFVSTAPNQFLIDAVGGVGMGTDSPRNQLDVRRGIASNAATANHVAVFENTGGSSGDVLALKVSVLDPGDAENFVTFKEDDGNNIGAIEGDGSGGVTYKSGSGDFAEYLPRLDPGESIEAAEVVGLHGGAVSKRTEGADRVMVVSSRPIVMGNVPEGNASRHEPVAFMGQVPVRVRGRVEPGHYIVPSGQEDGTGIAVSARSLTPAQATRAVGRALEARDEPEGVGKVRALVGFSTSSALQAVVERRGQRIEALHAEVAELRDLAARNADMEARLAALEKLVMEGGQVAER